MLGKTFLFTGTLKHLSRAEAKNLIDVAGGVVLSKVSKKLNFLVVGEAAGSKLKEANNLGVNILEEKEFLQMLKINA